MIEVPVNVAMFVTTRLVAAESLSIAVLLSMASGVCVNLKPAEAGA